MVEALEQTERVVNVGRLARKPIAVVLQFQLGVHFLGGTFVFLGQYGNVGGHVVGELVLCNAADGGVFVVHRDVRQVVDGRKNAQL